MRLSSWAISLTKSWFSNSGGRDRRDIHHQQEAKQNLTNAVHQQFNLSFGTLRSIHGAFCEGERKRKK
jgi:hypothetical protein